MQIYMVRCLDCEATVDVQCWGELLMSNIGEEIVAR